MKTKTMPVILVLAMITNAAPFVSMGEETEPTAEIVVHAEKLQPESDDKIHESEQNRPETILPEPEQSEAEPENVPKSDTSDDETADIMPEETESVGSIDDPVEKTVDQIPCIDDENDKIEEQSVSIHYELLPENREYLYTVGEKPVDLRVKAFVSDGCEAEYRWYQSERDINGNIIECLIGIGDTYTPDTGIIGTQYIFARASAEGVDPADSDIITITVKAAETEELPALSITDVWGRELIPDWNGESYYTAGVLAGENDTCILNVAADADIDVSCVNESAGDCEAHDGQVTVVAGINVITIDLGENKYNVRIDVMPTLKELCITCGEQNILVTDENGSGFSAFVNEYNVTLPVSNDILDLEAVPCSDMYNISYSSDFSEDESGEQVVTAAVSYAGLTNVYTVAMHTETKRLAFRILPEEASDAAVRVYSASGETVSPDADGAYTAPFDSEEYFYTISKYGYTVLKRKVPSEAGLLTIELKKNSPNTFEDVGSEWSGFRGSDDNMAITDAETPVDADSADLLWSKRLGDGWNNAPSVQIIADNALIVMCANKKLYKMDLKTGEILAEGQMAEAPNWGYTPPTYAEGLILCPLANGTIQAFNAKTLKSVWIYRDPKGGQSLSPITVSDGYAYTGFWNSYTMDAGYVCISLTDDRTEQEIATEVIGEKQATWSDRNKGGYYWAGSLAVGDYILVGGDDGSSKSGGDSAIHCYDKRTGKMVDMLVLAGLGDQRSSLAYSAGRLYFTTKDGFICSASLDNETGKLSDLKYKKSVEGAESTSTPVVYDGRVFFGVGAGYSEGKQQNFVVADADTLETYCLVNMRGNPQCSMLLSTAYEETGYLYFYSTYNNKPGGISLVRVRKGASSNKDAELIEIFSAEGYEEYCITSLICSQDGTLYYKNDSGAVMAVGVSGINRVERLINDIGTVDEEHLETCMRASKTARAAFEALSADEKLLVKNISVLEEKEAEIARLQIDICNHLIEKIPDEINAENVDAVRTIVEKAKKAFDSLTEAQRIQVIGIERLYSAQKVISELNVRECEQMIDMIPDTITADNLQDVRIAANAARSRYELLTDEERLKVSNYNKLVDVENRLLQPRVSECIHLIDLIPGKITEKNKEEAQKAVDAARMCYEDLTDAEKRMVPNAKRIQEAQRAINKLNAGGKTKKITGADGAYTLSEATKDVIRRINTILDPERSYTTDPFEMTSVERKGIVDAAKAYAALTEDEKLFVSEYGEFEKILNRLGMYYHCDIASGLRIYSETLPWNARLIAGKTEIKGEMADCMKSFLNGSGSAGDLYYLRLIDVMTGEDYILKEPVMLYLPCSVTVLDGTGIVGAFNAKGNLNLLTGSFVWIDRVHEDIYLTSEKISNTITRADALASGMIPCVGVNIAEMNAWYGVIEIENKWESLMDGMEVLNFSALPDSWAQWLCIPKMNVRTESYY